MDSVLMFYFFFFFSSRRRHTRCALVTGVQTCALPISPYISAAVAVVRLQHARASGKMFGKTSVKAFSVYVSIDIAAPFHRPRCVEHFLDADFGDHVGMRANDNAARSDFAQHRIEQQTVD